MSLSLFAFTCPPAVLTRPSARVLTSRASCDLKTSLWRQKYSNRHSPARMHIVPDAATSKPSFVSESQGEAETLEYRLFFQSSGKAISPWHDIPIYPNPSNRRIVNFIHEIPKGTSAKMEIATSEAQNPIKQDVKKGALRYYKFGPSLINYGAIPQTYEDPASVHPDLNVGGDGDPVDLLDLSRREQPFGAVYQAKILGALALLDEGEIDWKILAINAEDPLADQFNEITDFNSYYPGTVDSIREWFRLYKTAEGKGENGYGYNGAVLSADVASKIVAETHESWAQLRNGTIENDDELWLK